MLIVDGGGRRVRRASLGRRTGGGSNFGQTEVEDLGVPALGHEHVGRLNVAMDDALAMCSVEAVGDLNA